MASAEQVASSIRRANDDGASPPVVTLAASTDVRNDLQAYEYRQCGIGAPCPTESGTYLWDDGGGLPLKVVLPEGWVVGDHRETDLVLETDEVGDAGLASVAMVYSSHPDGDPSPFGWTMEAGRDPRASVAMVGACDGVVSGDPVPVRLFGLDGWRLDYTLADGWSSGDCLGEHFLELGTVCPYHAEALCGRMRFSVMLFDAPDGRQLMVRLSDRTKVVDGVASAEQVVRSITSASVG